MTFDYGLLLYRLSEEVAIIVFRKKDNTVRVLLGTRSLRLTDSLLGERAGFAESQMISREKNSTPANKNISLVDLIIEEGRQFNSDRVLMVHWLGQLSTPEELEAAAEITKQEQDRWKDFADYDEIQQAQFLSSIKSKEIPGVEIVG